jgi:hypothetical protein
MNKNLKIINFTAEFSEDEIVRSKFLTSYKFRGQVIYVHK